MTNTAMIICGALGKEVISIKDKYKWDVDIFGVDALLHNNPERITSAVKQRILTLREKYDNLIVVYGDCGTAGILDKMLDIEGVERVAGPHCYEMYGDATFNNIMEKEK